MEVTNLFITIGISVISGTAGSGLFIWVGKRLINNWFVKHTKRYEHQLELKKIEIQNVFDTRLEQLRIQYGTIYGKRTESIRTLYNSIYDLKRLLNHFTDGCKDSEEYYDRLNQSLVNDIKARIDKIENISNRCKIYFSDSTNEKICIFIKKIQRDFCDFYNYWMSDEQKPYMADDIVFNDFIANLQGNDMEDLINELIDEFRYIIGVEK